MNTNDKHITKSGETSQNDTAAPMDNQADGGEGRPQGNIPKDVKILPVENGVIKSEYGALGIPIDATIIAQSKGGKYLRDSGGSWYKVITQDNDLALENSFEKPYPFYFTPESEGDREDRGFWVEAKCAGDHMGSLGFLCYIQRVLSPTEALADYVDDCSGEPWEIPVTPLDVVRAVEGEERSEMIKEWLEEGRAVETLEEAQAVFAKIKGEN